MDRWSSDDGGETTATGVPGKIYEFSEINLDLTVESDAKCVHWVAQPIPHGLTERYFA